MKASPGLDICPIYSGSDTIKMAKKTMLFDILYKAVNGSKI